MPLPSLTDEQVRTWSLAEKDRWWRTTVYKGDMPQLTLRAALTGMVLGGVLSLTNLYVGIRTGWTLGVGITSVILSFGAFKLLARMGVGREMTILENNAMQSIATAAGYMTAPLTSSIPAYMLVSGQVIPPLATGIWIVSLSVLGVLFAFPLKKRFINDDQLPFPEGYAAGVVLDGLHDPRGGGQGLWKAKLLAAAAGISALIELLRSERVMQALRLKWLTLPAYWDDVLYRFVTPRLLGTPLRDLTIRLDTSIVMMGTGGLLGTKTAFSLFVGGVANYFVLAPALIRRGIIHGTGAKAIGLWSLWGGVALMTTAAVTSFLAKPQLIIQALAMPFRRLRAFVFPSSSPSSSSSSSPSPDLLADIELPMRLFVVGIPVVGLAVVAIGYALFGIHPLLGLVALPLVLLFTLIAVTSTALTAITPGTAIGKMTQLVFGALAPGNITTNVLSAGIASDVSLNASNLLSDIKPGYMLGAKPRQQAVGHVLGIFAGSLVAVPVYYLILGGDISVLTSDRLPMPSAQVWRSVAELLSKGLGFLHPSVRVAVVVGALLGVAIELLDRRAKGRFPLSGVALGLGFIIQFRDILAMTLGAGLLALLELRAHRHPHPGSFVERAFVENRETLCGGIIAGGSIVGIILILAETLLGG